ncbi:MAG: DUF4255 domain-containing protein [Verrucomicrobiae bacterium]|nr:DUF4255 domain-containing protein [Verrucomicrobiae bacterium]
MEIETAINHKIPILPVLIGNTPMPNADELPPSIATIAVQNAVPVGVLHDFHTHMQMLLPQIETILGALAKRSAIHTNVDIIYRACQAIMRFLSDSAYQSQQGFLDHVVWQVSGASTFMSTARLHDIAVTLFLHRVTRLANFIELHFIISFWADGAEMEHALAGWVIRQLEETPLITDGPFSFTEETDRYQLKVRWSDEDARSVWKIVTDEPLRLSLAYVATISPIRHD